MGRHSRSRPSQRKKLHVQDAPFFSQWFSEIGPIGVYIYIAGFAFPLPWDFPLILLISTSMLSAVLVSNDNTVRNPRLPFIIVALFLGGIGLSILISEDVERSLRLSASLLPAALLFFLITEHFSHIRDIRRLYCSCAIASLCITVISLWIAWEHSFSFPADGSENTLVQWSPILISRNDLTFLSLIAPLSLALAYHKPRSAPGVLAGLSMVLSLCVIVIFQSRGATLTMVVALTCTMVLLRPKWALGVAFIALVMACITDALMGFSLFERFIDVTNSRSQAWSSAWNLFLEAPFLGHGIHNFGLYYRFPWVHNLYLESLAEQGMIGFGILVSVLIYGLFLAWKVGKTAHQDIRSLGAGVFGSMVGFCFSGVFELSLLRQWVVMTLFIFLGVITKLFALHKEGINQ